MAYSDYENLVRPRIVNAVATNIALRLTQRNAANF
jgi:hypothetical protein